MKIKGTTITNHYGTKFDTKTAILTITKSDARPQILAPLLGLHKGMTHVDLVAIDVTENPEYTDYREIADGLVHVELTVTYTCNCTMFVDGEWVIQPHTFENQRRQVWLPTSDVEKIAKFIA